MQNRAAGVFLLQVILHFKSEERIIRISDRKLGAVRVVRMLRSARLKNIGEAFLIFLREPVSRPLSRRRFEVIHVPGFGLELDHAAPDVIQNLQRESVPPVIRDVMFIVSEIPDHFIHAVHADRGEMIAERAEVTLGVRKEPLIHVALDHLSLHFKRITGHFQQVIKALIEAFPIGLEEIAKPRAVDRDHTDGSRLLRGTEETVAALQKLPQIKLQTAAHRADHVRFQIRIDEVLEIMDLKDAGNKRVKAFSLGMKQRLGIAIALLGRPQLLILDEPINGLDPTKIKYVREVLKNMNEEDGTTILISSHILPELHQLATVYGFIHHGKMLQQITDKELDEKCRRHVHIEVDNVEKASCILDERYPESQIKVYLRNVIKVFGYNKNISDITKELVYGGVGVEKIGYEGEDLEEYYTNLLSEVKSNETA